MKILVRRAKKIEKSQVILYDQEITSGSLANDAGSVVEVFLLQTVANLAEFYLWQVLKFRLILICN